MILARIFWPAPYFPRPNDSKSKASKPFKCDLACGHLVRPERLTAFADANGIRYPKYNTAPKGSKSYEAKTLWCARTVTATYPRLRIRSSLLGTSCSSPVIRPVSPTTTTETGEDPTRIHQSGLTFVTLPNPANMFPGEQPTPEELVRFMIPA